MATTARGHIEQLPSGSFRVHVYAGTDPVTGKPRRLKQTCPDEASAAAALGKLLAQADGDHFPNRKRPSARPSPSTWKSLTSRSRLGRRTRATFAAPSVQCWAKLKSASSARTRSTRSRRP
jgi:hypothetical protein